MRISDRGSRQSHRRTAVRARVPILVGLLVLVGAASALASGRLVTIAAGTWQPLYRGATDTEPRRVRAFQMEEMPVTNAEYLEFIRARPEWRRDRVLALYADTAYLRHWAAPDVLGSSALPEAPVRFVSWFAARAYARWKGRRLATEEEWEYAASASRRSRDGRRDTAWRRDLLAIYGQPTPAVFGPVGQGSPNAWGLHDLHGVTWEWVEDFQATVSGRDSRSNRGDDESPFCGAGSLRASDRDDYPTFMRYALRGSLAARDCLHNLGFRTAVDGMR